MSSSNLSRLNPIQLLMPMSGQGVRFQKAGYTIPKPLIPVSGTPMVERLLSCFPTEWPSTFVMADNHRETQLPAMLRDLRPTGKQVFIGAHKKGPGQAILEGLGSLDENAPVLVSYCDYGMVWDAAHFARFVQETQCDAALVSYRGFHAHYLSPVPYAYSRMEGERVKEVREKGSFTDNRENEYASCGAYYFRTARLLKEAIEHQISVDLSLNGEYYTSLTVQALLLKHPDSHVRVFEIPGFFQWGTPEDVRDFEYWERAFAVKNRSMSRRCEVGQLLMPMAGLGTRFREVTPDPKPLIPIFGQPMYEAAIASMPSTEFVHIVTTDAVAARIRGPSGAPPAGTTLTALSNVPPGQALTVEAGLHALRPGLDVIVTSCDHAIALDPELWNRFRASPDCDAAIFAIRGFPEAGRRPTAFSYVVPSRESGEFPLLERVSLKQNTTSDPRQEHVLVGTFWFRNAEVLAQGVARVKERDHQVNGELYLDTIPDALRELGMRTRIVLLDGYINWGDPDSLAASLYWQEIFGARRCQVRPRHPGIHPKRNGI